MTARVEPTTDQETGASDGILVVKTNLLLAWYHSAQPGEKHVITGLRRNERSKIHELCNVMLRAATHQSQGREEHN